MEAASLATIRELNAIVLKKNYGRDLLYRCGDSCYLLLRYWNSEQARSHRAGGSGSAALLGEAGK